MHHGRSSSASSISWNPNPVLNSGGGSVSSGSPISSPLASPLNSPYASPCQSPREPLHNQFSRQMSLQPPSSTTNQFAKQSTGSTFVHKLYNMVVDKQYQHLIAWTYTGTSFIVCNITEFSRDVLPKHFKHNNFSSFVRQLNMYGFHKVNKSPRGHRALAENQIWEFSHPKFLRGRSDLLDEIKRKALESDVVRRDNGDMSSQMAIMQAAQSDMMQQLAHLQENFTEIVRELADTRRRQATQQQTMSQIMEYLTHHNGAPLQTNMQVFDVKPDPEHPPPPIYITSPDIHGTAQQMQNAYLHAGHDQSPSPSPPPQSHIPSHSQQPMYSTNQVSLPSRPAVPLTVQTQNLQQAGRLHISTPSMRTIDTSQHSSPHSPSQLSPGHMMAVNTPLPPSPSPTGFLSDKASNLYSQNSPHSPNTLNGNSAMSVDTFAMQHQLQQRHSGIPSEHYSQPLGYPAMEHQHSEGHM